MSMSTPLHSLTGRVRFMHKDYRKSWKIKKTKKLEGGHSNIFLCTPNTLEDNDNGLYVLKLARDDIENNSMTDQESIILQIELSRTGIMPAIYDCGYVFEPEYYKNMKQDRYSQLKYDKLTYCVMQKYMADGITYLFAVKEYFQKDHKTIQKLFKTYMTKLFGLYKKLSLRGICPFDVKDGNVVVNYDPKTFELLDMKLIDIDLVSTSICVKVTVEIANRYLVAMTLMHFTINYAHLREHYDMKEFYAGIVSETFDFDSLTDLVGYGNFKAKHQSNFNYNYDYGHDHSYGTNYDTNKNANLNARKETYISYFTCYFNKGAIDLSSYIIWSEENKRGEFFKSLKKNTEGISIDSK